MAQLAMLAEIAGNNGVSRVIEAQQLAKDGLGMGKQGGGETGFHGVPNSVAICS